MNPLALPAEDVITHLFLPERPRESPDLARAPAAAESRLLGTQSLDMDSFSEFPVASAEDLAGFPAALDSMDAPLASLDSDDGPLQLARPPSAATAQPPATAGPSSAAGSSSMRVGPNVYGRLRRAAGGGGSGGSPVSSADTFDRSAAAVSGEPGPGAEGRPGGVEGPPGGAEESRGNAPRWGSAAVPAPALAKRGKSRGRWGGGKMTAIEVAPRKAGAAVDTGEVLNNAVPIPKLALRPRGVIQGVVGAARSAQQALSVGIPLWAAR